MKTQRDARIDELKNTKGAGNWSEEAARLSVRADFRCEYCGLDFLESTDNYKHFQIDHIVPTSAGGKDDDDNKAIACWTCNFAWKSRWNPSSGPDDKRSRSEKIEAVKTYIAQRRAETEAELDTITRIVGERRSKA